MSDEFEKSSVADIAEMIDDAAQRLFEYDYIPAMEREEDGVYVLATRERQNMNSREWAMYRAGLIEGGGIVYTEFQKMVNQN